VRSTNTKWRIRARQHHEEHHAGSRGAPRFERAEPQPLRVRLEVPGLFGERAKARQIEQALSAIDGIREVRANEHSGTVLRVFDRAPADVRSVASVALTPFVDNDAGAAPSWSHFKDVAKRAGESLAGVYQTLARVVPGRTAVREANGNGKEAPAWHAMPADMVARMHSADLEQGLTSSEAEEIARRVGPNVLAGVEVRSPIEILAGQVFTIPTAVLASAAGLSVLLGDVLEAGAILFVVGSNIAVG